LVKIGPADIFLLWIVAARPCGAHDDAIFGEKSGHQRREACRESAMFKLGTFDPVSVVLICFGIIAITALALVF
jgi:hypothetical protein